MQCSQCQHDNSATAKFCEECGTRMIRICLACGHEVRPSAKFCEECGTTLTDNTAVANPANPAIEPAREPLSYTPQHLAEKILTSRSALEGERKQVTVLFADLKDSTELIKDLDPEDAQKLLDPAIHIMMEAVHRFEGTVNQVLGDGVMALFGAPIAHEDHALRACYAALAMQTAMQPYAEEVRRVHGITMRIRVGLNSGEVVVRTIGNDLHMDYSAVGQTTNLASRMEQLAAPGSIMLTGATLRLVEGFVRVNDVGPIPVKGMTEPLEVYELTGASTIRRRLQAAVARGLTKFVGRDTEIEALHQALEKAGAGRGQVVAAVGEAGVGKSRLIYEFAHSHRTQGWRVLESASVSYGKATPYFPVVDLLKRYVHVEDGDDTRIIRAKVTGQILTLDESLQETIPALLSLLDALAEDSPFLRLDPPQRRQRILDGLKRILLCESQLQPLLLIFEDLHWIDSETQALLDNLVESLPTAQMLLLFDYRPEYQHAWGSKTYYTQLRLDPLPPESADAFLESLLGNDPGLEPLKELLIERTEGNPFFLEESVRTLVEAQVLAGEQGAYRLSQESPTVQVPATVQAVLAARIDRLPPEVKGLLQTAAVIGAEVPFHLLHAIAEQSEAALYRGLTHLQAAEFVYETSLFPDRVYTFKHALTHEVAYGSLLQERRRVLHARIVETLEALTDDRLAERVERLAYHALRGALWDKALRYLQQAGDRAADRSAHREALVYFEQALEALHQLSPSHDTRGQAIDLRFDIRNTLQALGETDRILTTLREAEALAEDLGDNRRMAWVSRHLTNYFTTIGDYDQAVEASRRALALASSHEDKALDFAIPLAQATLYLALGKYRQTRDMLDPIIAALDHESPGARFGMAHVTAVVSRVFLVDCLTNLGLFDTGYLQAKKSIQIAEAVNHRFSLVTACLSLGKLHLEQGSVFAAIPVFERGLSLNQDPKYLAYWVAGSSSLGLAYALVGRPDEALTWLEQAKGALDASMIGSRYRTMTMASLSEGYLLAGRLDEARAISQHALVFARAQKLMGYQCQSLRLLGNIAMHRHPPDAEQAEAHYQHALSLANELGMRPLQAHCHRGLGRLYSQTGQPEQAHAELSTAIEMYRDMEMTFWLPETEAALVEVGKR